jgi:hypothetical protein
MKLIHPALSLILTACPSLATSPQPFAAGTGQMNGDLYEVRLSYTEHISFKWDPEADEWLMSTKQAIAAARGALTDMVGAAHSLFEVREVSMHRFWTPAGQKRAQFYFVVTFESMHKAAGAREVGLGTAPAVLPFLVFPDGYLKSPQRKEPNQTPEPTPTSVTSPAAQATRQP